MDITVKGLWDDQILRLAVPSVQEIFEYPLYKLYSPDTKLFSEEILKLIEGHLASSNQKMIMLLNPNKIFNCQPKN